jgi:hypothetical protein
MSIFGNIASAIFGKKADAATSGSTLAPTAGAAGGSTATGKPMTTEEVQAMIKKLADDSDQDFEWNKSIVDLMKLLKLDSSLAARKELAQELGYKGPLNGSAEMNIWLHKQVMVKLAEGGGKVPESMKKA